MNKMRLSPVFLAACTAIAACGWSTSANAQAPDGVTTGASARRMMGNTPDATTAQLPTVHPETTFDLTTPPAQKSLVTPQLVTAGSDREAQAPEIAPASIALRNSPSLTPLAQVPEQDTPNQLQLNPPAATPNPNLPTTPTQPVSPTPSSTPTTPAPAPDSSTPPTTPAPSPDSSQPEPRVLVSEVVVTGTEGELQDEVYRAIRTQPGRTTTRTQLQEDINAIFATGFFSNVKATPEDTALGVRVTFEVQPNPVLKSVQLEGNKIVPQAEIDRIFSPQYGSILNLRRLQASIQELNKWYQDKGFVLAQVVDVPKVAPDGNVTLEVAEGIVEDLQVRYLNKQGEAQDDKGNPIRGRTRDFIVLREFELKPGDVFNRNNAERDLQRAFGLGIFEDLKLSLVPGKDPRKVVVQVNVVERNTGSVGVAAGISSASGLFGSVSYQQQNLGGNNQKLSAEVQIGERERLFDLNFTDPWIAGDPYRTSYTLSAFRRRTISLIFDGGKNEVRLPANPSDRDLPRIVRTGGGITFNRPLDKNPYKQSEWNASLGLQYQRVSIRDADGNLAPRDELGNLLSFSDSGKDDLITAQLGFVRDRRNDQLRPTQGSVLRFGTEQSVPIGSGSILFNRVRASYSFYIPVRFTHFTPGCRNQTPKIGEKPIKEGCPQTLAFNIQGGNVFGDLPPYEAFSMGGSNSVRGYDEGEVGSGRRFVQATVEYRFPVFSIVSGALFVDAASDLGSGNLVPGSPAIVRGKPGSGIGYGLGVRIQSPLGPIRVDYGFNDQGESRLHFGIGERF